MTKSFMEFEQSIIRSLVSEMRESKGIIVTPPKNIKVEPMNVEFNKQDCCFEWTFKGDCSLCSSKEHRKQTNYKCQKHKKWFVF